MRLKRATSRQASEASLIPMINVVFLLLVFFMVAGAIRAAAPVPITPPDSASRSDAPLGSIRLFLADDGRLFLGDQPVSRDELATALDPATSTLSLNADAAVRFGAVRDTVDALRSAGVERVDIITRATDR